MRHAGAHLTIKRGAVRMQAYACGYETCVKMADTVSPLTATCPRKSTSKPNLSANLSVGHICKGRTRAKFAHLVEFMSLQSLGKRVTLCGFVQ
jgi:hypothetical protein